MRPPLGAPVGLLWDPQVTQRKPKSYANESQGNPKEGKTRQKSNIFENTGCGSNKLIPTKKEGFPTDGAGVAGSCEL